MFGPIVMVINPITITIFAVNFKVNIKNEEITLFYTAKITLFYTAKLNP